MTDYNVEVSGDFETQSELDLKARGLYNYSIDPSTRVLCFAYAFPGEEPDIWIEGQPFPPRLAEHFRKGGKLRAWNAQFEQAMWNNHCAPLLDWPELPPEAFVCTMAEAFAMALPGALENAGAAVGLEIGKDAEGKRIMMQLCKPRPSTGKLWRPADAPEKFQKLYDYCKQDVRTEVGVAARVKRLSADQMETYRIIDRMNREGVVVDLAACDQIAKVIEQATTELNEEIRRLTNGQVGKATNVGEIKEWLAFQNINTESLDKNAINDLLIRDDISDTTKRVLEIRSEVGKASASKIKAFRNLTGPDGRLRYMWQYHGATTGRLAARGVQLQNLPRPFPGLNVEAATEDLLTGNATYVDLMHGQPITPGDKHSRTMSIVASCLRGIITSDADSQLVVADLSQIEARMTAVLAGEEWKVEAFIKYDAKEGPDAYVMAAAGIYGLPVESVDKELHRPTGKVAELALGFLGGAGALLKMARDMRINLGKIYEGIMESAKETNVEKAMKAWRDRGIKSGTEERRWLTAELIKLAWRDSHPMVVQFAYDLEKAAVKAVLNPGQVVKVRDIYYQKSGSYLRCRLPSGRWIYYPDIKLEMVATPWGTEKSSLTARKMDNGQWVRRALTPGILIENTVQAASADVMTDGLKRIIKARPDHLPVLSIHDELGCQVRKGREDIKWFNAQLATVPEYLPGLPVAAAGYVAERYKK